MTVGKRPLPEKQPAFLSENPSRTKRFWRWSLPVGLVLGGLYLVYHFQHELGLDVYLHGPYQAESAVVVMPDPKVFLLGQGSDMTPPQAEQAVVTLAQTLRTEEQREKLQQAYESWVADELPAAASSEKQALPTVLAPQDYTLHFVPDPNTYTLTIRVQGRDPEAVKNLANVAAQRAMALYDLPEESPNAEGQSRSLPKSTSQKVHGFIDAKLESLEESLQTVTQAIAELETARANQTLQAAFAGVDSLLHASMADLEATSISRQAILNQLGFTDAQEAQLSQTLSNDPILKALHRKLFQTELQYQTLSEEKGDAHTEVRALKDAVKILQENWHDRVVSLLPPELSNPSTQGKNKNSGSRGESADVQAAVQGASVDQNLSLMDRVRDAEKLDRHPAVRMVGTGEESRLYHFTQLTREMEDQQHRIRALQKHLQSFKSNRYQRWISQDNKEAMLAELRRDQRKLEREIQFIQALGENLDHPESAVSEMGIPLTKIKHYARLTQRSGPHPLWLTVVFLFCALLRWSLPAQSAEPLQRNTPEEVPASPVVSSPSGTHTAVLASIRAQEPSKPSVSVPQPLFHPVATPYLDTNTLLKALRHPGTRNQFAQILQSLGTSTSPKVIGVCHHPLLAAALASVMSNVKHRVVLLDADVASPVIHEVFGIENRWGLLDLVQHPALLRNTLAKHPPETPLWVLPGGEYDAYLGEDISLDLEGLAEGLKLLAERSACVVINLPNMTDTDRFERMLTLSGCKTLMVCSHAKDSKAWLMKLAGEVQASPLGLQQVHAIQWDFRPI
jgi:hypothetical protein